MRKKRLSINRKQKMNWMIGGILFTTCLITFMICLLVTPKIKLEGELILKVPVGSDYEEPGYQAYSGNQDISFRVETKGEVDSTKVGTYRIYYRVQKWFFSDKKMRIVEVVDEEAPVLSLKGETTVYICPNNTYQEEGYEVRDNYDKDLNDKVKIRTEENEMIYEIIDSSGNRTTQKREIYYEDKESPRILLKGKERIVIFKGARYEEAGYQASDNCDGDITSKVKISGHVDTSQLGTYQITYQVEDASGHQTSVIRTVQVISKPANERGVIYLTFDDGPSSTITEKVLDILKQEEIPATFFVIHHADNLNYLMKREQEEGHTVAIHSYSHNYGYIYQSTQNYFTDLEKMEEKIKNITGTSSRIIRFPGGSSNTISRNYQKGIMTILTKQVLEKGYHYFDWNVSAGDAEGSPTSQSVYQKVISGLSLNRENVVLMHDFENNYAMLNSLRDIIHYGKENGYSFKKITMDTNMVTHQVNN